MKTIPMKTIPRKQSGITIVEFTLLASVLLLILFAIIEIAIYAYSLQSMSDMSRRAARIAAVCVVNDSDIKTLALSEGAPDGFTADNLEIEYLDSAGSVLVDPVANHVSIHYVRARIVDFDYGFSGLLSFLGNNGLVPVAGFQTILPAESLGVLRSDDSDAKTEC
ncbi:TadE/TadG family type IV pilus assembly protein [Vibrio japonicus]|uniref:Pilus assembly protein n=1 Tax=Vibrio japonicus TaxID=1824638 RepID=A0ABY5LDH0_9VIBR|nr:TadE/TadG family type IV pilus assembly protein [Vibrio japonicus]UUM30077.1 pilus assembly protein [Vibrio japonicus]